MSEQKATDTLDRIDLLNQKLAQLDAMLVMAYGEGGEVFRNMNDHLQDNYLWACSSLAADCKDLAKYLSPTSVESGVGRAQVGGIA